MFEKRGFDIYEGLEVEYLQQNYELGEDASIERRLEVSSPFYDVYDANNSTVSRVYGDLKDSFYRLEEGLRDASAEVRDSTMQAFNRGVERIWGAVRRCAAVGMREAVGPMPWVWRSTQEAADEGQLATREEELATGDWVELPQYAHRLAAIAGES